MKSVRLVISHWSFVICLSLLCLAGQARDFGNPLSAKHESERRGAFVEQVGGNMASSNVGDTAFLAATKRPADDSDKWSLSIVSQRKCQPCDRLKADFQTSTYLKAWVNVTEPQESHLHYTTYVVEDQLQNWRFANIKFKVYPTIVLNPPANGKCGKPGDYILIEGYNGDHRTLANVIRAEIKRYCYQHNVDPRQCAAKSKNPPEAVTSGEDGAGPTAQAGTLDVLALVMTLIPGGLTTLVAIGFAIWLLWRQKREKAGKPVLLSDAQFAALSDAAKKEIAILTGQTPPASVQPSPPSAAS